MTFRRLRPRSSRFNPLWLLIPPLVGPIKMIASLFRGKYSKEEKTGQRINARYEDIISRAGGEYELITTVHELMQHTFAKYASKNCFGTRTYLGEHTPEGARFPLKMFGETTWKSYREVQHRAAAFGDHTPLWITLWVFLAAEARQSKADCKARPTQPSQSKAGQAAEPNQAKQAR